MTKLWIRALRDNSKKAYRKLAKYYLSGDQEEQILGKLCLQKSMELGDEKSFFMYHTLFSKGQQVIEDQDYEAFFCNWQAAEGGKEKKHLQQYLQLGTVEQKKKFGVPQN